jgi:hypothetical protein
VVIDLLPDRDAAAWLLESREASPRQTIASVLKRRLPNRLVDVFADAWDGGGQKIGETSGAQLADIGQRLSQWEFRPGGSEGYRTAEVTLGGIATDAVSSKTFELKGIPACMRSARRSMSPAGSAATTSSGPGPPDGAAGRRCDLPKHFPILPHAQVFFFASKRIASAALSTAHRK